MDGPFSVTICTGPSLNGPNSPRVHSLSFLRIFSLSHSSVAFASYSFTTTLMLIILMGPRSPHIL